MTGLLLGGGGCCILEVTSSLVDSSNILVIRSSWRSKRDIFMSWVWAVVPAEEDSTAGLVVFVGVFSLTYNRNAHLLGLVINNMEGGGGRGTKRFHPFKEWAQTVLPS